jgi:hypothetical protein
MCGAMRRYNHSFGNSGRSMLPGTIKAPNPNNTIPPIQSKIDTDTLSVLPRFCGTPATASETVRICAAQRQARRLVQPSIEMAE